MKLVSSYDNAYEAHERSLREDEARQAQVDYDLSRDTAANLAQGLYLLLDDPLCDLDQAESETRDLLQRIERLKLDQNHARTLLKEMRR